MTVLANRITYLEPATPSEQEGCRSDQWTQREQSERKGAVWTSACRQWAGPTSRCTTPVNGKGICQASRLVRQERELGERGPVWTTVQTRMFPAFHRVRRAGFGKRGGGNCFELWQAADSPPSWCSLLPRMPPFSSDLSLGRAWGPGTLGARWKDQCFTWQAAGMMLISEGDILGPCRGIKPGEPGWKPRVLAARPPGTRGKTQKWPGFWALFVRRTVSRR